MDKPCNCWQITFKPTEHMDEELSFFLEEYFDVVACNYIEELEEFVGYLNRPFDKKHFEQKAKEQNIVLLTYKVEELENKDWLKEIVIQFEPIETEDFLIYGIHEDKAPETNKIPIKVFAATAFGSSHQTTIGCLSAISKLHKQNIKPETILDVGTGSGILSLACAKLWKKSQIIAVDIDPESIRVTEQNAIDNQTSNIITSLSDGYNSNLLQNNSPYDIIIANILARPLIDMSKDLYNNLKGSGYCIISGFNSDQEEWVIGAHAELGLEHLETLQSDNWCIAIMRKK